MIKRNIKIKEKLKTNTWRKVALSAWNVPNEPVIFSRVQLNVQPALEYLEKVNKSATNKITITHYLGKVCGILLHKHPELNSSILYKHAYVREGTDVFFHVSLLDEHGNENLSGIKIKNCALKSIHQIAAEAHQNVREVKSGNDITFKKIKKTMRFIPLLFSKWIIKLTAFIQYRLNLWSPLLGTQQDTFGSLMITNIGSLGIEEAFVPFSFYTNVHSICAIGKIFDAPIVENGELKIGPIAYACWTLDHRVVDGSSAGRMLETFRTHFENPELIEKFDANLKG